MNTLFYLLTAYNDDTPENEQIKSALTWLYEEIYITNTNVVNYMNPGCVIPNTVA